MPTNTSIPTLDGKGTIPALVVKPAGTPRGAIIVVQEIFGVNPGIVLISLMNNSPVPRLRRKSTRASPAPSMARNACRDCRWISAATAWRRRR